MRLAFILVMTLVASACAAGNQPQTTVGLRDVDEAQMQAVEEAAEHRGVRVYWMNPPLKSSTSTNR